MKSLCTVLFLISVFFLPENTAASRFAPVTVSKPEAQFVADSLQRVYGSNKHIPQKFVLPFYYALSYYPELAALSISIREKKLKSTMAARPAAMRTLFRSRSKRHYIIYVNTDASHASPQYHEFTFNAQIGLFGHELAHFLHYLPMGKFSLIREAIHYRKDDFKGPYERRTDSVTIARGLGWQCYDFASQLQANPDVPDDYKKRKEKLYYSAREIFSLMGDLGYDL